MKIIGLIAEYNPIHLGHIYQIQKIKELYKNSIIILITNSTFTQRGEVSIINKWDKTKIALDNGIDIVIELPFVFATQSSDIFAKGAVQTLENLHIDTLVFGTEADSIDWLKEVADLQLNNKEYDIKVKKYLDAGLNYPTATNKAIQYLTGNKVNSPNNI